MIISKAIIRFTVDKDTIIPPFSSKVSRSMILKLMKETEMFNSKSYKPYSISPIFVNNKPLIKSVYSNTTLELRKGKTYNFRVAIIDNEPITSILDLNKTVELFDTTFHFLDYEMDIKTFGSMLLDSNKIMLKMLTPLLLQIPSKWGGKKRVKNFLFPVPSLLIWSLSRHWNVYAPDDLKIESCKKLAIYSNYSLIEFNYHLRPISVIYDDDRKPTGITGWIIFEIKEDKKEYDDMLKRLFAYANYVGIGRSRAIGFGMVSSRSL